VSELAVDLQSQPTRSIVYPLNRLTAHRNDACDYDSRCVAVVAAISLAVSNGQVEGQVNRPKLIKRSMVGRANFDLLCRRVLAA
jgi:transposase